MNRYDLGKRIQAVRIKMRIPQETLADVCKMSRTKLSRIENGITGSIEDYEILLLALHMGELMPVQSTSGTKLVEYAINSEPILTQPEKDRLIADYYDAIAKAAGKQRRLFDSVSPSDKPKGTFCMERMYHEENKLAVGQTCNSQSPEMVDRGASVFLFGLAASGKTRYFADNFVKELISHKENICFRARALDVCSNMDVLKLYGYTTFIIDGAGIEAFRTMENASKALSEPEALVAVGFAVHDIPQEDSDETLLSYFLELQKDQKSMTFLFDEAGSMALSKMSGLLCEFQSSRHTVALLLQSSSQLKIAAGEKAFSQYSAAATDVLLYGKVDAHTLDFAKGYVDKHGKNLEMLNGLLHDSSRAAHIQVRTGLVSPMEKGLNWG